MAERGGVRCTRTGLGAKVGGEVHHDGLFKDIGAIEIARSLVLGIEVNMGPIRWRCCFQHLTENLAFYHLLAVFHKDVLRIRLRIRGARGSILRFDAEIEYQWIIAISGEFK